MQGKTSEAGVPRGTAGSGNGFGLVLGTRCPCSTVAPSVAMCDAIGPDAGGGPRLSSGAVEPIRECGSESPDDTDNGHELCYEATTDATPHGPSFAAVTSEIKAINALRLGEARNSHTA